jgi:hypothetical protein
MPYNLGTTSTEVGVRGSSETNNGVEGRTLGNGASREPNAGGNGVLGVSLVPNASGVFGAHNNGGTGVAGFSKKGTGVAATSEFGAGVLAKSTAGPAVYGISAQRAARFDGPVEINGDLIVNGKTLNQIIREKPDGSRPSL